jgi:hypothetical protein
MVSWCAFVWPRTSRLWLLYYHFMIYRLWKSIIFWIRKQSICFTIWELAVQTPSSDDYVKFKAIIGILSNVSTCNIFGTRAIFTV